MITTIHRKNRTEIRESGIKGKPSVVQFFLHSNLSFYSAIHSNKWDAVNIRLNHLSNITNKKRNNYEHIAELTDV